MILILGLYSFVIWLIFYRFRLLPLNGTTKTLIVSVGVVFLAVFLALLNSLTPSGRIVLFTPTVEVAAEVSGKIEEIHLERYRPVKAGDLLFVLNKEPFQLAVDQAKASHDLAQRNFERVQEMTTRNSAAISVKDLDIATSEFNEAKAALQLAEYNLERTDVRAVSDGIPTDAGLDVGDSVVAFSPLVPLIKRSESRLVGAFDQTGRQSISSGVEVGIVFRSRPGHVFWTSVKNVLPASAGGAVPTGGALASSGNLGDDPVLFAMLEWPEELTIDDFETGSIGQATVISEGAGPIGSIARILLFVKAYRQYF